jgi:hypothetical protein
MPAQITEFDRGLADAVTMQFNNGPKIVFQFPPKITSDSRKGEWHEGNLPGTEPVAVYQRSGPREISLTWTYIVDGSQEWTTDKVAEQVKIMRGYFARTKDPNVQGQRNLIVFFKMWNFGGSDTMSCRIKSVDVKHSETIVTHCTGGNKNYDKAYPLRTDITIELRLWTRGSKVETQDLKGLKREEETKWY